jgi:predicted RNA-binding protein (virulence factor B family)
MNQEELYAKFDNDVVKRSRLMRLLLAIDQFFNVLIWDGSQDQTISGHIYRRMQEGRALWIERKLCCFLRLLESKHCMKSRSE